MPPTERDRLIEENLGLVGRVIMDKVHSVNHIGIYTYDDLIQIGRLGLCAAADSYKPGKASFSTYAYISIRNEIFSALEYATARRNKENVTDPDELPKDFTEAYVENEFIGGLTNAIMAAQARASGITAKGIEAIRLLAQGYTHREIGERMGGVSANNVTAWVARARKFLQADPTIVALRESESII